MGRITVSVIRNEVEMEAKESTFSLQSLVTCSSFQAEKLSKRCFTKDTYFAIRGSHDSYSSFTCPATNCESLRIRSLSADTIVASSIPTSMVSYSDSLLEALKPKQIAYLIISPIGDLSCKSMPTPVWRDAPSTLRIHHVMLPWLNPDWGISARKSARTCPFLASLGLYQIPNSLSSIAHRAILSDKSGL